MPKLSDYTLDQLLAIGSLAKASPDIQAMSKEQINEIRLLQIRELMRVYNGMQKAVKADDPKTWVYGDEAEAYFHEHIWPWHINMLLEMLDEARTGNYTADPGNIPHKATGPLTYPYNVYEDGDLDS